MDLKGLARKVREKERIPCNQELLKIIAYEELVSRYAKHTDLLVPRVMALRKDRDRELMKKRIERMQARYNTKYEK